MRAVFQINTVYQLFIAINMCLHHIPDGIIDIIVSDHTPALKKFIPTLKNSGLFHQVFWVESLVFNHYFWGIPNNQKAEVFYNTNALKRVKIEPACDYSQYDALYTANLDAYTKFLHKAYPRMSIYQIEDGASVCSTNWKAISSKWNYIDGFNNIYDDVKNLYLYSPEFMRFQYPAPLKKLPNIAKTKEVIDLYNYIFQYIPIEFPRFVFIEQSFQADNIKNNDLDFLYSTFDIVGYQNLYVKPHPRNTVNRPFFYGLCASKDDSVPFELMLLNNKRDDVVYITVDSGSLISTRVIFEENVMTIFLYNAIIGKSHIHGADDFFHYMEQFVEYYQSPKLLVPGSLEEYKCELIHLIK